MQETVNQVFKMNPLFFDPIGKKAHGEQVNGKLKIMYIKNKEGVVIAADGSVTFQIYAPQASKVELSGLGGSLGNHKIKLDRKEDGYFSKTVFDILPGFHYCYWYVDDVKVINQQAPICYGCFQAMNFFEVPDQTADFYYIKDVPHGDVQLHKYMSHINSHMKQCYVYTPPSYGKDKNKKYPVLYVQHGVGENETGWIWNGKLNFILDNMIAQNECEEMIVVMCCGYAFKQGEDPVFYPGDFDSELVNDCIPYIESQLAVKKGRKNRAMAGLSLGSAQASLTASKHQALFAYLGVFSGLGEESLEVISGCNANPMTLIYLSCGKGEEALRLKQEAYAHLLQKKGIPCVQESYEGYHEWHVWRQSLRAFVKQLFRHTDDEEHEEAFKYQSTDLSASQAHLQTFESDILFYDRLYKKLILAVDKEGRLAGRYGDVHKGAEILPQGIARFWFLAPEAKSVQINIMGSSYPLEKADSHNGLEGYWTVELSQITPGFHYYDYCINETETINPMAPIGYGCFKAMNFLEIPEEDFETYKLRDVPHGIIHLHYYQSSQTHRTKMCYVYTPPSYTKELQRNYPVLYLQHGGGENETGWIWHGKIAHIADNLIANKKMEEMIIVMNTGYAFPEDGCYHPSMSAFLDELPMDCVPNIDLHYRTISDRTHRGMAGLSMGGMQTQKIVFSHPELFAWAGIFSGGLVLANEEDDYTPILFNPEKFIQQFKMLFISYGLDESFYKETKINVNKVLKRQVPIIFYERTGYHDWTLWRHCVEAFLVKVFRD